MKRYMNNKGYLLPMVLIFIVIAVILGMGILYLGGLEQIGTRKRLNREKAFYIAEAGAYRAYVYLKEDPDWDPEEGSIGMEDGSGSFSVVLEEDDEGRTNIVSTGTVKGIEETVKLVLGYSGGGNIWSQGLFGSERVTLENNVKIYGYDSTVDPYGDNPNWNAQVGSLELITLKNNSKLYGDAYTTAEDGIPPPQNNSDITGSENEGYEFNEPLNQDPLPQVEIPPDLLVASPGGKLEISNNRTIPGGDYRYEEIKTSSNSVTTFTGDLTRIYVEKKVEVENNSKWDIQGTLILYLGTDSNLFVKNNSKIGIVQGNKVLPNLPADFQIYSASTKSDAVILENNSDMAGLLYVPEGGVLIKNNREFLGGIVTDKLDLSNNIKIYYDVSLQNMEIPGAPGGDPGQLTILRWTKPTWVRFQ